MNLVQRIQDILLKPKDTWPAIDAEGGDTASIYKNYLIYIALVPAVAGFIGMSIIGMGVFGMSYRVPLMSGLANMVVGYVMSLVMVFVLSLIANALAPTFGGTKNPLNALKLVAFGSTAGFLGGIFSLLPSLSILGLLAAAYSIYLIYTGVPVMMKSPPDKAVGYTAVLIICGIVAALIVGALSALFGVGRHSGGFGSMDNGGGNIAINTPDGSITLNTSKLEAAAKQMEEAGKRMESAQASGDPAAAGKAVAEMMGAMGAGAAFPTEDMKAWLPAKLAGQDRTSFEVQGGVAMGIAGSTAKASYGTGDSQFHLSVTDAGGMGALMGLAAAANMTMDKETATSVEKAYKTGKRSMREDYQKDGSRAEITAMLENGLMVELKADQMSIDKVKQAMAELDLSRMESAKRPPAKPQ